MSNLVTVSGKETDPKKIAFAIQQLSSLVAKAADTLQIANNLSDVSSVAAALINLGLGTAATHSATDFLAASSNLSDVASTTTARLNLGLGTAAVLNAGTSSNSVVKLDSSAKLPAVDGSQLTNLPNPMVLLNTLIAANSASLTDTTSFTSTYARYRIDVLNLLPGSSAVGCRFRFNIGGTVQSTTSYTANTFRIATVGTAVQGSAIQSYIGISALDTNDIASTGAGITGQLTIDNPSGSSAPKLAFVQSIYASTGGVISSIVGGGWWNASNSAVGGFEISPTSGSWVSGVVKVYGIK